MIADTYPLEVSRRLERLIRFAFGNVFNRTFQPTFSRIAAAAAVPWWLTGGIAAANCIAAYQPKGAASLAASYTNLANPGTYNAAPGTAPTWDATNGWKFASASSQYLTTGVIPADTYSAIVQFSSLSGVIDTIVGQYNDVGGGACFLIDSRAGSGNTMTTYHGTTSNYKQISPAMASGNYALAGKKMYRNGVYENNDIGAGTATTVYRQLFIGALNYQNGTPANYCKGNILAVAFYDINLTAVQVAALYTAMNAL